MNLCLFEDAGVASLEPLALTRPAFELWCGSRPLSQRQVRYFGLTKVSALVRPHLADLCRVNHPDWSINDAASLWNKPVALANARWLAPNGTSIDVATPHLGMCDGKLAYALVPTLEPSDSLPEDLAWRVSAWQQSMPVREVGGSWIDYPWDLVSHNAQALAEDAAMWTTNRPSTNVPEGVVVLGPREQVFIDPTARLEALVVVDTTGGPVMIDRGAVVQAFSRLEGPCYVGAETQILAGRLRRHVRPAMPHRRRSGILYCPRF